LLVSREGGWTDEATDLFEDLCHVAQWRVLMARVDSYKERERGEREGSPIPVVELYDTSGAEVGIISFLVPYSAHCFHLSFCFSLFLSFFSSFPYFFLSYFQFYFSARVLKFNDIKSLSLFLIILQEMNTKFGIERRSLIITYEPFHCQVTVFTSCFSHVTTK
jgi:hypothetical protein